MTVFILVNEETGLLNPYCFDDDYKAQQEKTRLEAESDWQEKWKIHWFTIKE